VDGPITLHHISREGYCLMHGRTGKGFFLSLLLAAALVLPGCGGRAVSRATTSAQARPVAEWEHPSRLGEATPATRLPDGCVADCDEDAAQPDSADREGGGGAAGGVRVSLQPGMTLYSLSREYDVPLQTILRANDIHDPTTIRAGTEIYIPTPVRPSPAPVARTAAAPASRPGTPADVPSAPFLMSIAWPINGRITGGYGQRGRHHHHDGIDIDGVRGEEVRAVAAGIVVRSGNEGKYGKTVVIDHGNGVTTLYAHASRLLVREGDEVEQGETIAEVGASGNARGTHLHFEVRRDGRPVDPVPYLKPEMMGAPR
jgi:LysM repeat protein